MTWPSAGRDKVIKSYIITELKLRCSRQSQGGDQQIVQLQLSFRAFQTWRMRKLAHKVHPRKPVLEKWFQYHQKPLRVKTNKRVNSFPICVQCKFISIFFFCFEINFEMTRVKSKGNKKCSSLLLLLFFYDFNEGPAVRITIRLSTFSTTGR